MRWWKLLGLAGLAGVTATGVVLARHERERRAYTPDDVRARLHARAGLTSEANPLSDLGTSPTPDRGGGPAQG